MALVEDDDVILSRDNLDENGASIWMRRGRPSGAIIDAGRRLGKALIDAERQSVFGLALLRQDCSRSIDHCLI